MDQVWWYKFYSQNSGKQRPLTKHLFVTDNQWQRENQSSPMESHLVWPTQNEFYGFTLGHFWPYFAISFVILGCCIFSCVCWGRGKHETVWVDGSQLWVGRDGVRLWEEHCKHIFPSSACSFIGKKAEGCFIPAHQPEAPKLGLGLGRHSLQFAHFSLLPVFKHRYLSTD